MGKELFFLEDMLFKSTYEEIEERYAEVIQMYAHDPEIINIAKSIKGMCDYIMKTYKEIPNPEKKLELKEELTKELATKADLQVLKAELEARIEKEVSKLREEILKLDRKFTIMFLILLFAIILLNKDALEFIARLFGLIK